MHYRVPLGGDDLSPLAGTEVHYLDSEHVGDEFKIFVGRCGISGPGRVPGGGEPPEVLYLTDANGYFGGAVDLIRSMQLVRHLPPMLVVGIGYRAGPIGDTIAVRTRDLTPSADPAFARLFPGQQTMGGAGAFGRFIDGELRPWVRARYAADDGGAAYFGHSLGGLFGTHVLLTAPETFRHYIIGSPSLWWHDDAIFGLPVPGHAGQETVYFGVGADETHEGRQREAVNLPEEERAKPAARYIDMVADTWRMAGRLRDSGWAQVGLDVFPGEYHVTVPFQILSRGLRRAYGAP